MRKNQVNLRFCPDALKILNQYAPSPRAKGEFLSRLLYEYAVRTEMQQTGEREALKQADHTLKT